MLEFLMTLMSLQFNIMIMNGQLKNTIRFYYGGHLMENKEMTTIFEEATKETSNKSRSRRKEDYKVKECKVMRYNKNTKTLDVRFDKYGIRLKDIDDVEINDTVLVKYKGEIGKSDFSIKI